MVPMRSEKKIHKQIKRKRILETILSIVLLFAILLGGATGYYGSKITSFLDGISSDTADPADPDVLKITQRIEDLEPFSALILGTDVVDEGTSRSDTIIVATVNPKEESLKMVSLPRDTIITLPNGVTEKMNAIYSVGGPILAREMIGDYLDIPIEFYATMDFRGLVELVDAVDGITIDSELAFTESNYVDPSNRIEIQEGVQTLDGAEALGYARMRKQDPRGDFGRQDRQQEVIIEVLDELISFNSIANLTDILNAIQPYLQTNATSGQMLGIAGNYSGALKDVEQLQLDGLARNEYFPHYGFEVYVWEPSEESLAEVQHELRTHLDLETDNSMDLTPEIENAQPSDSNGFNNGYNN